MRISLVEFLTIDRSASDVFDHTNDVANFTSFAGFGPIPGIREARYMDPGQPTLGSRREVLKTDGTMHIEEITAFDRPHRHTTRITGLKPPFSWLVRSGQDDWELLLEAGGTRVVRRFSFDLTSPAAYPVAALLLYMFMREAVRRDLAHIKAELEG